MKTCENCKKIVEDDARFCPYCGNKIEDDKDELKKAMAKLMEEEKETNQTVEIVPHVSRVEKQQRMSRVERQKKLSEDKENKILNKILIALSVLLVCALLITGIVIGINMISHKKEEAPVEEVLQPVQKPETNKEDKKPNQPEKKPENTHEPEKEPVHSGNISFENNPDSKISVVELLVSREDSQIRLDVKLDSKFSGELYLKDTGNLKIGPLNLKEGTNSFYFLINGNTDYILVAQSNENEVYETTISKDKIQEALKAEE